MDTLKKYKAIARQITLETGKLGERPENEVKTQFILDDENGQYLLYFNGWRGERRTYGCYLHLEVNDNGRVYLHHDGTDLIIAQQLIDAGIPKSDIVLAFHAPVKREDSGFALN